MLPPGCSIGWDEKPVYNVRKYSNQFCNRYYEHLKSEDLSENYHNWQLDNLFLVHSSKYRWQNWRTLQEVREGHDGRQGGRAGQGDGDLRAAAPHQGGQVHYVLVLDVHLATGQRHPKLFVYWNSCLMLSSLFTAFRLQKSTLDSSNLIGIWICPVIE